MKTVVSTVSAVALALVLFTLPGNATNSLVNPEGIKNMKSAGIDDAVIRTLAEAQTCSVSPHFLIELKRAGAGDETLIQVILADRYHKPEPSDFSLQEIDLLRKAGCSQELISTLQGMTSSASLADDKKHEGTVYRTDVLRDPGNGRCEDNPKDVYINIEKVEGN